MNTETYAPSSWTQDYAEQSRAEWQWPGLTRLTELRRHLLWIAPTVLLAGGWYWRDALPWEAEAGIGYALGLTSAACILILLVYPIRKRIKLLAPIGTAKTWFLIHMTMGVSAPVAALYHCGFSLGSLNSQVALLSILIVSGSGLIGRFLYRRIYSDWSGKRRDLKRAGQLKIPAGSDVAFLTLINERLARLDEQTQDSRHSLAAAIWWAIGVRRLMRREREALTKFGKKQLHRLARTNRLFAREERRFATALERFLVVRSEQIIMVARTQVYERLFALWHVAHLPFFLLLVLSVVVHVLAVHLY